MTKISNNKPLKPLAPSHLSTPTNGVKLNNGILLKPPYYHDSYIDYQGTLAISDLRSLPVYLVNEFKWIAPGMNHAFHRDYDLNEYAYSTNFALEDKTAWLTVLKNMEQHLQKGDKLLYIIREEVLLLPENARIIGGATATQHYQAIKTKPKKFIPDDTYVPPGVLEEKIKVLVVQRGKEYIKIAFNDGESTKMRNYNAFKQFFSLRETDPLWDQFPITPSSLAAYQSTFKKAKAAVTPAFILYTEGLAGSFSWETFISYQESGNFPIINFVSDVYEETDFYKSGSPQRNKKILDLLEFDLRLRDFDAKQLTAKLQPGDRITNLYAKLYTNKFSAPKCGAIIIPPGTGPLNKKCLEHAIDLFFFVERDNQEIILEYNIK